MGMPRVSQARVRMCARRAQRQEERGGTWAVACSGVGGGDMIAWWWWSDAERARSVFHGHACVCVGRVHREKESEVNLGLYSGVCSRHEGL